MTAVFDLRTFSVIETHKPENADYILRVLKSGIDLGAKIDPLKNSFDIEAQVEFPMEWGLGSSSSLISNLAGWMEVDVFELLWSVSRGSGYDVACARSSVPILYRLHNKHPEITAVGFNPVFKDSVYFIYSGNKQDSEKKVAEVFASLGSYSRETELISRLTSEILAADTLEQFSRLIREHEMVMASVLGQKPVKESRFPCFKGEMKSLGAWGGDFLLVTWTESRQELHDWFKPYGLDIVLSWDEMVLPYLNNVNSNEIRTLTT